MFALSSPIQTSDPKNIDEIEKYILTVYEDIIGTGTLISLEESILENYGHLPKQETPHEKIKKNAWQILGEAIVEVDLQTAEYILKHCQPINLEAEVKPKGNRRPNSTHLSLAWQNGPMSGVPLYLIAATIFHVTDHTGYAINIYNRPVMPVAHMRGLVSHENISVLTQAKEFLDLLLLYDAPCTNILHTIESNRENQFSPSATSPTQLVKINALNSLHICNHLNLARQNWQNKLDLKTDSNILSALCLSCNSDVFLEKYIKFNIEIERDDNFKEFFKYLINQLKYYSADSQFKKTYERCKPHIERFEQLQYNKLALEEKNEKSITPSSSAQDSKKSETNSSQGSNPISSSKFSPALAAQPSSSSPSFSISTSSNERIKNNIVIISDPNKKKDKNDATLNVMRYRYP